MDPFNGPAVLTKHIPDAPAITIMMYSCQAQWSAHTKSLQLGGTDTVHNSTSKHNNKWLMMSPLFICFLMVLSLQELTSGKVVEQQSK